jgi:hypothetical protein
MNERSFSLVYIKMFSYNVFVFLQGTKINIRGVEDIPRHVDVPIAVCDDLDPCTCARLVGH